jgi:ABC-type transport system involved in cytochrome c biogenesis permease subunit
VFSGLLIGGIVVVTLLVLTIATILALTDRTVEDKGRPHIQVPYASRSDIWAPFRSWVIQEDGRKKPFETYCIESVRTITGLERFEKTNDPVAVVLSWMMLSELDERPNKVSDAAGKKMNCDWENYPLILCDHHDLRKVIFPEAEQEAKEQQAQPAERDPYTMSAEEKLHGKHVSPAQLRGCKAVQAILDEAAARMEANPKYEPTVLESKAREAVSRLNLYDLLRTGGGVEGRGPRHQSGEFQVVALDRVGGTWFSLASLHGYLHPISPPFAPQYRETPEQVWNRVIDVRAENNEESYKDRGRQPLPEDEMKKVLASYEHMQTAYRSGDADAFQKSSAGFLDTVSEVSRSFNEYPGETATDTELWYNRSDPFQKAWIIALLATMVLGASILVSDRYATAGRWLYGAGMAAYLGSLVFALLGFYCRCVISGRPPVSNMYESIIFVGTMTAVFGLVLELVYRRGVIALAGSAVSTLCLVLADQLPLTFPPGIQPLNAVLRSNYWLIIHVMTIVSSYAALALAWGLGNFNLALILFAPGRRDLIKTMTMFCYRAIQIGVILLFLGTMLGGFWAAESWGRFWGWDPKEVWALIAFLFYIIPLHMRYVGWIRDFGLAACAVICFSFVVMAWYGVNFVLKAGLHSYGFGGGGNWWVYLAGWINFDLVLIAALRYLYRSSPASVESARALEPAEVS